MSLDEKISQLASAGPLTGAEEVPIVQGGVTKRTTVQEIANKNDVAIQNNEVYVLEIDSADLSGIGSIKDQICAYILALPAGDRTILKTQSKWNVVVRNYNPTSTRIHSTAHASTFN